MHQDLAGAPLREGLNPCPLSISYHQEWHAQVPNYYGRPPKRNTFGFFLGMCEFVGWSYGKRMRAWFVTEVQKLQARDLAVECSGHRRVRLLSAPWCEHP